MLAQIEGFEQSVKEAYTALFNQIHSYPDALCRVWWSGAYRTLDHRTTLEQLAAIKVYSDNARRAYDRYMERTAHNG